MKLSHIYILLLLFIALQGCNDAAKSPYPDVEWTKKRNIPLRGLSSSTVACVGEKAYVLFGRTSSDSGSYGEHTNACWEYNAANDEWTKKTACPGVPRVNAVSVSLNGKIYAGLGFHGTKYDENSYLGDFWMYDPQTDSWERKADYPSFSTDDCIGFAYENKIYIGIGFHGTSFGRLIIRYYPETDTWEQMNEFPGYPRATGVGCAGEEHIYMGTGYTTTNLNDWWEYLPVSDSWKKRKEMPDNGRISGAALSVNNRYFVSTGRYFAGTLTGGHLKSDIIEYDAVRNVWYKRGNIPTEGRENAIAFTINGKGYIGLGEGESGVLNDLWSFEP